VADYDDRPLIFTHGKNRGDLQVALGFDFILRTQASGAKVQLLWLAIDHDCCRMDIRIKPAIGMMFRMTYIFTEHRCFPTNITLQNRYSFD